MTDSKNVGCKGLNIVVAGKSGVGKSSLLNYLVDKEIFETGIGSPITQDYFERHIYNHPTKKVRYTLYDTKGIEPDTVEEFEGAIFNKIEEFSESEDIFAHIHTLYYCIAASSKRIEPFEINFIKRVNIYVDVVVVLTKADLVDETGLRALKEKLRDELDASATDRTAAIKIVQVCNVTTRTRKGESVPYGRDLVLSQSFMGLWNTLSKVIPDKIYDVIDSTTGSTISFKHRIEDYYFGSFVDYQRDLENFAIAHKLRVEKGKADLFLSTFLDLNPLEDFGFQKLAKSQRDVLLSVLKAGKEIVENLYVCVKELSEIGASLEQMAFKTLNFYTTIFEVQIDGGVPLIQSKKKLQEIIKFIADELKPYLLEAIENMTEVIIKDDSADGWWDRLGSEDKREQTRIEYKEEFLPNTYKALGIFGDKLKEFTNTCSTEFHQYGCLMLKNVTEPAEDTVSVGVVNCVKKLSHHEKLYYDSLSRLLNSNNRSISEDVREKLDFMRSNLGIEPTRAGLIEDFCRSQIAEVTFTDPIPQ